MVKNQLETLQRQIEDLNKIQKEIEQKKIDHHEIFSHFQHIAVQDVEDYVNNKLSTGALHRIEQTIQDNSLKAKTDLAHWTELKKIAAEHWKAIERSKFISDHASSKDSGIITKISNKQKKNR